MIDFFVFDTNTLVSAFLFKNSSPRIAFKHAVRNGRIICSKESFAEFKVVLLRPKFDKYLSLNSKHNALKEIEETLLFIDVKEHITACRDPKDNKFLELAVAANASCIITGDADLLVLNPFREIPILNASDFLISF